MPDHPLSASFDLPESPRQELQRQERQEGDGAQMLFELLREKWRLPVLLALLDGAARYSGLNRRIPTVSHTMLTRALRDLEHGGMVRREVFAAVPTKVEYTLTALGRTLAEQLRAIDNWALEHENNLRAILLNLQREAPAEPNTTAGGE